MKKNVFLGNLGVWVCLLYACSSSEDEIPADRLLQMYGAKYAIDYGVIWQNNPNVVASTIPFSWQDVYVNEKGEEVSDLVKGFTVGNEKIETGNFIVSLYEDGIMLDEQIGEIQGKAACISLHLSSPDKDKLIPGRYVFDLDKKAYTFSGYCSSEYDSSSDKIVPAELADGEVIVEKIGDDYKIEFSGKTSFGGNVSAEYYGPLKLKRISQITFAAYNDIVLTGLLDSIYKKEDYLGNVSESYILDEEGKAFFSTVTGKTQHVRFSNRSIVDIALYWERNKEVFCFESPIYMRQWLWHQYEFPCHTKYMKMPESFTDADFDKLEETGIAFEIKEENVEISIHDFKPGFVLFETGNGVQGIIRYKKYTPISLFTEEWFEGYTVTSTINPTLLIDVKCPATISNPQIR